LKKRSKLRTFSQVVSAAVFLLLFFFAVYPLAEKVPFDIFLRLDPLIALGAAVGLRELSAWMLPALITIAVTLVAGRLFCSYFCPLGGAVDLADAAASRSRRKALKKKNRRGLATAGKDAAASRASSVPEEFAESAVTSVPGRFTDDTGSSDRERFADDTESSDRERFTDDTGSYVPGGSAEMAGSRSARPAGEEPGNQSARADQEGTCSQSIRPAAESAGKINARSGNPARNETSGLRRFRPVKFGLLFAIIISALFGSSLLFIFDPLSFVTRSAATVLHPLAALLANGTLDLARPLLETAGFFGLARTSFIQPVYTGAPVFLLLLAAVLGAAVLSPRFWCRYLCPLGALLGLLSLTAPVRRRVTEECNSCGACRKACPMDAIGDEPRQTAAAECIGCRSCARACPLEGIAFSPGAARVTDTKRLPVDAGRRTLLLGGGAAMSLVFLARTGVARKLRESRLIRPPGALPEEKFLVACVRCGECMKACITNTLQPAVFEAGLEGLWTPRHEMRLAGCEQDCNVCGRVCPTGAIRSLPLEEKKSARIGTAVIRKELCVAWEHHMLCLKCDEACPYNAIVFKVVEGEKRPFVDETKCNGCGICEQVCPVLGDAAIFISPTGEIRLATGSYIAEAGKLRKESDSKEEKDTLDELPTTAATHPGLNDAGTESSGESSIYGESGGYGETSGEGELPPGFLP